MTDDCDYLTYEQEVMERVKKMHEALIHQPETERNGDANNE